MIFHILYLYTLQGMMVLIPYMTLLPNNWISDQFGIKINCNFLTPTQTLHLQSLQITFKTVSMFFIE